MRKRKWDKISRKCWGKKENDEDYACDKEKIGEHCCYAENLIFKLSVATLRVGRVIKSTSRQRKYSECMRIKN